MKIALGQMHIRWEDKAANLARVENWAELLKEKNIDLFVLPEMSLTGFSMHTELTKETDNITVAEAERLARKYQMAVGIGWVKDVGKFCENRYSIVTPEGAILEYTKLHPFSYSGEDRYFQGGTVLPVCEYRGYHLGVQICYDLRFPETFQALSRQADLILVLDDGELVGKGIHDDLIRTCDTYREIYFSQFPEEREKYNTSNTAVSVNASEVTL